MHETVFGAPSTTGITPRRREGIPVSVIILVTLILFHLAYVWRFGAYSPFGMVLGEGFLFLFAFLFLAAGIVLESLWNLVVFKSARSRVIGVAALLFACLCLSQTHTITQAQALRSLAFRRDLGPRAQRWAESLLTRPYSYFLDPKRVDPHTDKVGVFVKETLVPSYLKGGNYTGVRIHDDKDPKARYLVVSYRWFDVEAYYLGASTLDIQIDNDEMDQTLKLMPGVYARHVERM
ncbi:MAG TPA: hypothetical protein VGM51_15830 [Armatimonadota bacterium]|jgi:hypothetical protein